MMRQAYVNFAQRMGVALLSLALAACGDSGGNLEDFEPAPDIDLEANAERRDASASQRPDADASAAEAAAQAGLLLAYSYSMGIEAPKSAVSALKDAHESACMDAGLDRCQVLSSSIRSWGDDDVSAVSNYVRRRRGWRRSGKRSPMTPALPAGELSPTM